MIETLSLRNFKVLREVEVELRPLTLIVGPNASGKSTLLEALHLLSGSLRMGHIDRVHQDAYFGFQWDQRKSSVMSRRAEGPFKVGFSGRFDNSSFSVSAVSPGSSPPYEASLEGDVSTFLATAKFVEFDVQQLAAPSYMKEVYYDLPRDGGGLSSLLAGLYLEHLECYREIVGRLKKVVPLIEDVRLKRVQVEEGIVGYELSFDTVSAESVPAHSVSAGTLITLGLLTVLSSPQPPQLVLIDDLERGLHPKALGELVNQFRQLQQQNPELQIVATSHSPYLLDYVKAEEVLLTSLDQEGYAVVKSLTQHPEYERWKDLMAPGEFWSTVGESWVTEQPAAK